MQKICVTGFLFHNNKVLILKRSEKESFLPGYFEMPGGKVDFGETCEEALKREMKEEIGIGIEIIKPYSTFSYTSSNNERHTIDIQYIIKHTYDPVDIKLSNAHTEYKWATKEEIENYKISDLMIDVIRKGFRAVA